MTDLPRPVEEQCHHGRGQKWHWSVLYLWEFLFFGPDSPWLFLMSSENFKTAVHFVSHSCLHGFYQRDHGFIFCMENKKWFTNQKLHLEQKFLVPKETNWHSNPSPSFVSKLDARGCPDVCWGLSLLYLWVAGRMRRQCWCHGYGVPFHTIETPPLKSCTETPPIALRFCFIFFSPEAHLPFWGARSKRSADQPALRAAPLRRQMFGNWDSRGWVPEVCRPEVLADPLPELRGWLC